MFCHVAMFPAPSAMFLLLSSYFFSFSLVGDSFSFQHFFFPFLRDCLMCGSHHFIEEEAKYVPAVSDP